MAANHFFRLSILFLALLFGFLGGGIAGALLVRDAVRIDNGAVSRIVRDGGVATLRVAEESQTVNVVKSASPAVVSIIAMKDTAALFGGGIPPFERDFFEGFGFVFPDLPPPPKGKARIGAGSGFFVSSDGMILTNRHVVADPSAEYTVLISDGRELPAKVVAKDPFNDLAVLKVGGSGFTALPFARMSDVRIGQTVIAIGYALGEFQNSVTKGVISGINRRVVAGDRRGQSDVIYEAIQTDAAINPGNSGGPLVDLAGAVVGVNTAVSLEGQLVGFAIPAHIAEQAVRSVTTTGKIARPFLGIHYIPITKEFAERNKLAVSYGAFVAFGAPNEPGVMKGGPAEAAGLKEGDMILEMNGTRIDEANPLAYLIQQHQVGETVTLNVWREGRTFEVKATLGEFK